MAVSSAKGKKGVDVEDLLRRLHLSGEGWSLLGEGRSQRSISAKVDGCRKGLDKEELQ
jgi:hypothetical protein